MSESLRADLKRIIVLNWSKSADDILDAMLDLLTEKADECGSDHTREADYWRAKIAVWSDEQLVHWIRGRVRDRLAALDGEEPNDE